MAAAEAKREANKTFPPVIQNASKNLAYQQIANRFDLSSLI